MSLIYQKLVADLFEVFLKEGTSNASLDLSNHAQNFATAIDDYTKKLLDPGNRNPSSTNKTLISSQITLLGPGTSNFASSANIAASYYALGISNYISAIQLSLESLNNLPTPLVPPGTLDQTKTSVVNLNVVADIQSDFKSIFNDNTELTGTISNFILGKSTRIAEFYQKYVTNPSNINVKLGGKDSNPLVAGGVDFLLTGPFKEE